MSNKELFNERIASWRDSMQENADIAKREMDFYQSIVKTLNNVLEIFNQIESESTPVQPIKDNKAADLYNFLRAENQEYEAAMALLQKTRKMLADAEAEHKRLDGSAILDASEFAKMHHVEKLIAVYKDLLS